MTRWDKRWEDWAKVSEPRGKMKVWVLTLFQTAGRHRAGQSALCRRGLNSQKGGTYPTVCILAVMVKGKEKLVWKRHENNWCTLGYSLHLLLPTQPANHTQGHVLSASVFLLCITVQAGPAGRQGDGTGRKDGLVTLPARRKSTPQDDFPSQLYGQ